MGGKGGKGGYYTPSYGGVSYGGYYGGKGGKGGYYTPSYGYGPVYGGYYEAREEKEERVATTHPATDLYMDLATDPATMARAREEKAEKAEREERATHLYAMKSATENPHTEARVARVATMVEREEKEDTALSVKQSVRHKERAREAKEERVDTTHPAMVNPATDMVLSMALDTMEAREERVDTMALAMADTTEAREERVDTMALAMVDTTE